MRLQIEVPPGELIDKLTILQIKADRIRHPDKLKSVRADLAQLTKILDKLYNWCVGNGQLEKWNQLTPLTASLKKLNEDIWDIEDRIRKLEKHKSFGGEFIDTARAVYFTNDKRAMVKKQINELFDSDISEEKSYTDYA